MAGNGTTGSAVSVITFHVLNVPTILNAPKAELRTAVPKCQRYQSVTRPRTLQYLSAISKEGLRMSYGIVSRMPRHFPNASIRYKDPMNTLVSINDMDVHDNHSVFTDPKTFSPDRDYAPSWTNN